MLELIRIRNLAVIDQAEIPFEKGLNILSGETGAGKSIVLQAISLILGERASQDLIRHGAEEAVVEGIFALESLPEVRLRLARLGFFEKGEPTELLVKRTLHRSGKGRILINGELATLQNLQAACEGLVDLCSQHEHQSLLKPAVQINLVDRFAGIESQSRACLELFAEWKQKRSRLEGLKTSEADRLRKIDFLRFQAQELEAAGLSPGEEEALQSEKKLLQSAHQRLSLAEDARALLDAEEGSGALSLLRSALSRLQQLESFDAQTSAQREILEQATIAAEETLAGIEKYLVSQEHDPKRLEEVQARLSKIAELKRKYGATVESIVERLEEMKKELSALDGAGVEIEALELEIEETSRVLSELGASLCKVRRKAAKSFSERVTQELSELKMQDAKFVVALTELRSIEEWNALGGPCVLEYRIQANRGDVDRPLGRVASGGELSRIMLAIRRVISGHGGIGVYLFDEIDAGMGGQTAFTVGKKLKSVAQKNQVICITHLPQVAAFADHHLTVYKSVQGTKTHTRVKTVEREDRVKEVARMLAGDKPTPSSLQNAKELMRTAR